MVCFCCCKANGQAQVQTLGADSSIYFVPGDTVDFADENTEDPKSIKLKKIYDPKKAAMLSAAFPGLGQIYNKKYWKLPFVYGGLAALGYGVYWNNKYFVIYTNAYFDYTDGNPTTNRWKDLFNQSDITDTEAGNSQLATKLDQKRTSYRRDRDFMIILTLGMYVLNIIDASVDAHLSDFDISKDISLRVEPEMKFNEMVNAPSVGMRCKLRF